MVSAMKPSIRVRFLVEPNATNQSPVAVMPAALRGYEAAKPSIHPATMA